MTDICGITYQLQQDPGNFLVAHQYVIRPLQARPLNPRLAQYTKRGEPDNKTQTFQHPSPLIKPEHQAVVNIFSTWANPFSPSSPSASELLLSEDDKGRRKPTCYQPQ